MSQARNIGREIGTALAVLAIYLLTILAPLHEARASQLVFEELGYTTLQTGWVLCSSAQSSGQNSNIPVSKCPVTGVGKPAAIAPGLNAVVLVVRATELAAPRPAAFAGVMPAIIAPPSGPRGPPEPI
jgi:hypothetical protein